MKVKDFIDFLKLPPNILAALSLVTGIILFVPDKALSKLYMVDFRNNYGFIISIVFLISTAISIVFIVSFDSAKVTSTSYLAVGSTALVKSNAW